MLHAVKGHSNLTPAECAWLLASPQSSTHIQKDKGRSILQPSISQLSTRLAGHQLSWRVGSHKILLQMGPIWLLQPVG